MPVRLLNVERDTVFADQVYADANLFVFSLDRTSTHYQPASNTLGYLQSQNVNIFISNLVIDEMWWALLKSMYRNDTGTDLFNRTIKSDPSILSRYSNQIVSETNDTLELSNVTLLPQTQTPNTVLQEAGNIFLTENLGPRDCFHLAYTKLHNIEGFVTSNGDFDNLNFHDYDLTVYKYDN